eukprot:TRINITY_DN9784_c0_g1_i3.p1 TRINITY_DN9784_c0_g1~~TRINITY_DN9784_c0_g1_i3.p1  ORF type:complete len:353 (+),score=50.73 TRINITY_DN9784_c0_g1_i3:124-1059(+)
MRSVYCREQRCGPHFSFVEPFIASDDLAKAAKLLEVALKDCAPFTVIFKKCGFFLHQKSATLYLEPTFDPPNALQDLLSKIVKIFPQCDDLIKRSKTGKFIPHLTLARFKSKRDLNMVLTQLEKAWKLPIKFELKELYLLTRKGGNPFQVQHVVPLGPVQAGSYPFFGINAIGSPGTPEQESAIGRSLVICGLPKRKFDTDAKLEELFTKNLFKPKAVELSRNPDLGTRSCGVVEFASSKDMHACLEKWDNATMNPYPNEKSRDGTIGEMYVCPLYSMVYPDVIKGSCSVAQARKEMRPLLSRVDYYKPSK